jgi:hypothetical protein
VTADTLPQEHYTVTIALGCLPRDGARHPSSLGHGQTFTQGRHLRVFCIDPTKLPLRSNDNPDPSLLFFTPQFDYSRMPIPLSHRDLDLSSFARSEGWIDFVAAHHLSAEQIQEVVCRSSEDDGDLHDLKSLMKRYLHNIQPFIKQYSTFGLQRLMANVGLYVPFPP